MDVVVTKYPELGLELRVYSFYDGRGEGAQDMGAAVYTLDGVKIDTSGAMSAATYIMDLRIERENARLAAEAAACGAEDALANAAKAKSREDAASRINAALDTLRNEGLDLPRWLVMKVNRKGELIAYGADRSDAVKTLERDALALCAQNADPVALEDAIADVFGLLEG